MSISKFDEAVRDALRQMYIVEETGNEEDQIDEMDDSEEVEEEWMFEEVDADEDITEEMNDEIKAEIDAALAPIAAKLDDIDAQVSEDDLQEAQKGQRKANLLRKAAMAGAAIGLGAAGYMGAKHVGGLGKAGSGVGEKLRVGASNFTPKGVAANRLANRLKK
jgi:hypothetical protein